MASENHFNFNMLAYINPFDSFYVQDLHYSILQQDHHMFQKNSFNNLLMSW